MSNYLKWTKHPKTGEWFEAEWLDDYFGHHRYGVRFPTGTPLKADDYEWEVSDTDPREVTANPLGKIDISKVVEQLGPDATLHSLLEWANEKGYIIDVKLVENDPPTQAV